MDDNLDLDSSDPFMSKGHSDNGEINQSDLLNYQMANQQVPGSMDDYHSDETDNSLLHGQNQSSFIPPYTGKELVDSSLSDSNRDWEQEDDMMFNQGSSDPLVKGSVNQFQPDLLNMNPLSLESKSSHEETSFRDDFFAPNNLSEKPIAQSGYEEHVPSSQPPDLLMMESSASHTEATEGYEQTVKTCDTDLKSCGDTDLKSCDDNDLHTQSIPQDRHEAIENDFYNEDEHADHYDDEYVDSDESDYTDESMDKMEGQTGLEHIVPDICDTEEKQQPVEIEDTENALNNSVDPNIGASGITQKDSDYLKNVQFEDNVVHSQLSDEENGNMAVQASQPAFTNSEHLDLLKQEEKESLGSDSEDEFESATPQQITSKESNEDKVDLISDQQAIEGTSDIALNNKDIPIESDDSDMEERSLTPDPNQSSRMETGPPFHDFVGGQSTDQVQISGLVEGTLMEESESTDDEELEQQCQVPLEQLPGSAAMTMEQTQQIDNNFVTKSEHVDQFDLHKGHILEGLSDNGEKHFEDSFEQSHSLHEQQEVKKQNSFDNQDLEMESRMQHKQLNEAEKINYLVSDELEISHKHEEGLLTESNKTLSESNAGVEMATNPSVEPLLSEIPSSEEVQQQTLLSTETFESENQNIGQDVRNNDVKGTLDEDVEQVDTKPDILEYSDESEDEIDDGKIQNEQSGMDGSIVMEEGETLGDKKMEESISSEGEEESLNNDSMTSNMMENNKDLPTEQEISSFQPANYSTDLQMTDSQLPEPGVEASIIPDEGQPGVEASIIPDEGQISDRNEPVQLSPDNSSDEVEIPANQMRETGMEGSFVLDEDETFEDKQFDGDDAEFVQSTPETSPEDEIPTNQMKEPIMLVEDIKCGGEKTDNEQPISDVSKNNDIQANQMRESGMEGSFVLEEGETFDDNKYAGDVDEFVQSTPEISPEEEQIPQSQMRETGLEDSLILDEGETFEDKKYEGDQAGFEHDVNEFEQTSPEISPKEEQIPQSQMRETGMEGSLVLDEGETFEDKNYSGDDGEFEQSTPEVSPEDEVPVHQMRESGMEGSLVLDEGETFEDKKYEGDQAGFEHDVNEFEQTSPEISPKEEQIPQSHMRETGMEGSLVLDEGETFEDKNYSGDDGEFEQSTPEVSPEDEVPVHQMRESGMEGSLVLDEGETFEDKKYEGDQAGFEHDVNEFEQTSPEISPEEEQIPQSQMRETGMEGSLVLDEGETFDDKNYDGDDGEFEQSTPEVSPEDEVPMHQMRESGMEGSFVLEEGETFDDKQFESNMPEFEQSTPEVSPEEEILTNQKRETGMEGSFVFDEGETFEDNKVGNDEDEFEQSTPEDDIQTSQLKTTGMDDSAILDKCEQFDDTTDEPSIQDLSSNQREDLESFVAPVGGQTMDDGSEAVNYSEESIQFKESVEEEMKPLVSLEKEEPDSDLHMENQDKQEETTCSLEPADGKTIEGHLVEESMGQQIEEVTSAETPTDSYGMEGDVDSAIQSPLSQNDMLQSPSSDENAQLYVEHENEKNLMSSSLTGEFVDQDEAIQTYQPCMQNGVSHSASEEVTPEKEENEHPCFQNGISQSTSDEFTPEREEKTDFNLTEKEGKQEIVTKIETKSEVKDSIAKSEVKKKTGVMKTEVKRIEQSSPKKTLKLTKPDSQKKDITKETKKITKDTTRKKDTLSKLPSPTKTEKRSMSTSRLTTPPTRTDKPATRMPRDTTRKPRPASTTEPAKQTKQRPKSIDISRTSSLTRPTKSSLCKSRTFEKSALEGASSPTKPLKSVPKTAPSRYRITRSKKDASSDSGVEEDKSPRKTETQKKSQDDKMTRSTSAKRSTIPTMNRTQPTKSEGSPRKTAGKPTPTKTTQSKIGSLNNTKYSPGGGQVKIQSQKQDFSKVSSKIGSKDYLTHKPAGGEKKILSQKLEWKAESKVGSLKNATYSPRGGNVKIQTEKLAWNVQSKVGSLDNSSHSPGGGHVKITNEKINWKAEPRIGSMDNTGYVPGGGNVHIENKKLDFKDKAQSKVGSKDHMNHKAGGGDKKIESQKLMFKEKAQSKVGSKDNIDHKPLGGDKKIDTQKLTFKETAKPRTDTGVAPGKSRPDSGIECEKTEASV
ncbi:microtubule-associated protein futsch-like isoform X2 [Mytilus californianus]|uniref:microtubule-associated protein futsch-like isoform X2 n=1 Tax=Mytilus californianus TaxID=6549 RepID=UPI002245D053|nr:microtubule-associated protein futsch-like isoform X2 [Mytilus californianus]